MNPDCYVRNDNEYLTRCQEERARTQFRNLHPPVRQGPQRDGISRTWRGPTVWVDRRIATGEVVAASYALGPSPIP